MTELWTPNAKPKEESASFRFPAKIMLTALQIADRAHRRSQERPEVTAARKRKRLAAKRARKCNRAPKQHRR